MSLLAHLAEEKVSLSVCLLHPSLPLHFLHSSISHLDFSLFFYFYERSLQGIWGPFLVICPKSTLPNWQQEFAKFLPAFKVLPYWGSLNERKVLRTFWYDSYLLSFPYLPFLPFSYFPFRKAFHPLTLHLSPYLTSFLSSPLGHPNTYTPPPPPATSSSLATALQ